MASSCKWLKITSVFFVAFTVLVVLLMACSSISLGDYLTLQSPLLPVFNRHANDRDLIRESSRMSEQSWIDCMTDGEWIPDPKVYSKSLETSLNAFFRETRDLYHLPDPLQRIDDKCGTVSFGVGRAKLFRAVCDPFRSTPCCFAGTCKNISKDGCVCPGCFDLRRTLHGELSKWVGHHKACPIQTFSSKTACDILRGTTLVFIGDSFMRQMFMGTQILLTNNDINSCVWRNVPEGKREHCQWMYMFTRQCRFFIPNKDLLCNGTVTLRLHEFYTPGTVNLREVVRRYQSLTKTTIIVGVGLHYSFNSERIINHVALPILGELRKMSLSESLHHVKWILPHSLGILKSPSMPNQLNPNLLKFNREMREFLAGRGITMVDAFNLTRNLASYDGSHYPKAPNVLKVQILLNHLLHKRSYELTTSEQNNLKS